MQAYSLYFKYPQVNEDFWAVDVVACKWKCQILSAASVFQASVILALGNAAIFG